MVSLFHPAGPKSQSDFRAIYSSAVLVLYVTLYMWACVCVREKEREIESERENDISSKIKICFHK